MSLRLQRQPLKNFQFCAVNNVSIEIEWVPSSLNEFADSLSRVIDVGHWSVSAHFFLPTFLLFSVLSQLIGSRPQIRPSVPGFILNLGVSVLKALTLSVLIGRDGTTYLFC